MKYVKLFEQFVNERTFDEYEIALYDGGRDGMVHIFKRNGGYYGYNDAFDFEAKDKKELEKKLNSWGYELISGSIDESVKSQRDYSEFKSDKEIVDWLKEKGYGAQVIYKDWILGIDPAKREFITYHHEDYDGAPDSKDTRSGHVPATEKDLTGLIVVLDS